MRAREATAARRARARGVETASVMVNEDKLYERHEAIGGGAAARAPLRAAGRRCLPLLRMRLILFVLLAFGPSAGGWREPISHGASGAVWLGPRAPPAAYSLGLWSCGGAGSSGCCAAGELWLRERSRPGNGWGMRAEG